jgi:signal transduction histidine kinase
MPKVPPLKRPSSPPSSGSSPIDANGHSEPLDLSEIRAALDAAQQQIKIEVERREKAVNEFEQQVAADREKMRKQLHDGLGQVLTSISFLTNGLQSKLRRLGVTDTAELDEIARLINTAIVESRAIAANCDNAPRNSLFA